MTSAPAPKKYHFRITGHTASQIVKDRTHSPLLLQEAEKRASSVQLRVADAITAFAGSMAFVYVHVLIFGVWIATGLFGVDKSPFQLLTLIVSLEAIFLSTFVMIGQNRSSAFAQAKADHDFNSQEKELDQNTELTKEIHRLTQELHAKLLEQDSK
jgi:uncharacterized membrane protein